MNHANSTLAKTEIIKQLGYFPAFLIPAIDSSAIYQSLVRQTLSAYIGNLLPARFKEKLFVILSRYAGISYFTICHSCTLRSLGMSAAEILALENIKYPQTEEEVEADLQTLSSQWSRSKNWQDNPQVEASLLRCSNFIFAHSSSIGLSERLKSLLGTYYHYLIVFLGYIKLCHQWVIDNRDISHQQDRRSQLHLGSLLLEEIRLAQFFKTPVKSAATESKASPALVLKNRPSRAIEPNTKLPTIYVSYPQLKQKAFTTLANASFPVMIHTQQGQILYFNRNWLEATGYAASEISTIDKWNQKVQIERREIVKLPAETDWELFEEYATQAQQTAVQTTIVLQQIIDSLINIAPGITKAKAEKKTADAIRSEVTISTSDGEQLFWELYSAPLSFIRSEDELTISIARDITDLVRQQTKLSEIEAKLRLVLEATKTGEWSWNLINNRVDFCHHGRNILGWSDSNVSYESFLQLIHPDETEAVNSEINKTIQTRQDLELKCRIIKSEREISWIQLRGKLHYNAQGQPIRLSGIVTDITQPQMAEVRKGDRPLQSRGVQSVKELKTVINLLPYYLFVVDLQTQTISLINFKLARSLGLSDPEAASGRAIAELFSEYAARIAKQHQQVIANNRVLHIQEEVALPDGIHYLDTIITPLHNERGDICALLHTSSNLPDLAATQEALSQRTLQLEAANKELESFSYSVSHDLQAPLRIISGFSQVLWNNYQSDLDEGGRHYLERIQANSKRMRDLIDALLQLSKVTRSQMKFVNVNLSAIALEIVEELQARDPQRQVELTIAPDLWAKGDPQLLGIVLRNLFDNAWKYTSKRSHSIIEFDVLDRGEDRSTYYLRDNGAGFDLNYADKLFTPFHRLHSQSEFLGTGIGLATVQRIIYRHDGRVWAEAQSDRGATIYFYL